MSFLDELKNADAEERAELAACGITYQEHPPEGDASGYAIASTGDTSAQTDAVVSQLQRRLIALREDMDRYGAAAHAEMEFIRARYDASIGPVAEQFKRTEKIILDIAAHAEFGKKKSRATPFGSYGRKTAPARIEIVDPALVLAWAKENAAFLVDEPPPKPQPERVPHDALCEFMAGEPGDSPVVIPGVVEHPERDVPFVKLAKPE